MIFLMISPEIVDTVILILCDNALTLKNEYFKLQNKHRNKNKKSLIQNQLENDFDLYCYFNL